MLRIRIGKVAMITSIVVSLVPRLFLKRKDLVHIVRAYAEPAEGPSQKPDIIVHLPSKRADDLARDKSNATGCHKEVGIR